MASHGQVASYWAEALTEEDARRYGASLGDPAWQSEGELLAIFVSLHVFATELRGSWGCVVVQSDSKAAWGRSNCRRRAPQ